MVWSRERGQIQGRREDARCSVWFLRFGGTSGFRIWGGYAIPWNDLVLVLRPNQTREPPLGPGRTHYIPVDDLNQTHPSYIQLL